MSLILQAPKEPGTAHLKRAQDAGRPALPLHRAAAAGNAPLVTQLLQSGTDPCLADGGGKTAYEVAGNKDVRNAMRRHMAAHPQQWDYAAARIPSALDPEKEQAQVRATQACCTTCLNASSTVSHLQCCA